MDIYSPAQISVLTVSTLTSNILSLLGASMITIMYAMHKELRTFAFYLIFNLALCDSLYAISNLLILDTNGYKSSDSLCLAQAFGTQMFAFASILWTCIISYTLYQTVIAGYSCNEIQSKTCIFTVFAYCLPFVVASIMLGSGIFGVTDEQTCWIEYRNTIQVNMIVGIASFYVPLVLAIIFNSVVLWKVIKYLNSLMNNNSQMIMNRLKLYPLILIICWMFGVINRCLQLADLQVFPVLLLHTCLSGLPGFFNFIAYGLQKQVQDKINSLLDRLCCCCCCRKEKEEKLVQVNNETNETEMKTNNEEI